MTTDIELGIEALLRGEAGLAVESLERACRGDPGSYRARMALGAAYGDSERPLDAVRVIEDAIRLKPRAAQGHYNLALALERAARPTLAEAALKHALLLEPYYNRARVALARLRGEPPSAPVPPSLPPAAVEARPSGAASRPKPSNPEEAGFILPPPGSSSYPAPHPCRSGEESTTLAALPPGALAANPPVPHPLAPPPAIPLASASFASAGVPGRPRTFESNAMPRTAPASAGARPSAAVVFGIVAGVVLLGVASVVIASALLVPVLFKRIPTAAPGVAGPRYQPRLVESPPLPSAPGEQRTRRLERRLGPLGPQLAPRFAPGLLPDSGHPAAPGPGGPEDAPPGG